jgi:hypothetical protein
MISLKEMLVLTILVAIMLWLGSTIALGQDAQGAESVIASYLAGLPSLAKVLGFAVTLQVCLRLLAELLIKISAMTETNADNKVAAWVSEAAWVLGVGISKFGYSVPNVIIEEKAKELPKDGQT